MDLMVQTSYTSDVTNSAFLSAFSVPPTTQKIHTKSYLVLLILRDYWEAKEKLTWNEGHM